MSFPCQEAYRKDWMESHTSGLSRLPKKQANQSFSTPAANFWKWESKLPTLIKPNIDEIRMLTGKHCDDIQDIIDAAKTIHAKEWRS